MVRVSRRALCRCSVPAHASSCCAPRPPPKWDPAQRAPGATATTSSDSDGGIGFPHRGFRLSLTLSSKSFSPFLRSTCAVSVSDTYSALGGDDLPFALHSQATLLPRAGPPPDARRHGTLTLSGGRLCRRLRRASSGHASAPTAPRGFGVGSSLFVRHYWGNLR